MRRALVGLAVCGAVLLAAAGPASAHPLGNFTVNRAAIVTLQPRRVAVDYVVDEAEIPAFQDRQAIARVGEAAWAKTRCEAAARGLHVWASGHTAALALEGTAAAAFPTGAGGLPTLRLDCPLGGATAALTGRVAVRVADDNEPGRLGWREIVVAGDGVSIDHADVPAVSPSNGLTAYPQARLSSPLDVRQAAAEVTVTGRAAAAAAPASAPRPVVGKGVLPLGAGQANRFAALVARRHGSAWFLLSAMAVALLLGSLHAFAPGHGKTVMAAYLLGKSGRLRDAGLIAVTVTLTHTAGVLVLGGLLSASRLAAPERLYPWLTLASGGLFMAFGLSLLRRAQRAHAQAHHHDHDHDHDGHDGHDGHDHDHDHHGHGHHHDDEAPSGWRSALWLGFAGGLVPTPSALVVLVGAIAIGRSAFGVVLVLWYGVGMALSLTGVGFALARGRRAIEGGGRWPRLTRLAQSRLMPLAAAAAIVATGSTIAVRGLAALV